MKHLLAMFGLWHPTNDGSRRLHCVNRYRHACGPFRSIHPARWPGTQRFDLLFSQRAGSQVYGYGLRADESIVAQLRVDGSNQRSQEAEVSRLRLGSLPFAPLSVSSVIGKFIASCTDT